MRSALMISAVVLVGLALVSIPSMPGQEKAKPVVVVDDGTDAFEKEAAGKVLLIVRGGTGDDGYSIGVENAQLRTIGGRRFIRGTYAKAGVGGAEEALAGAAVSFAWDSITEYLALTPQAYRKWLEATSDVSTRVAGH